MRVKNRAIGSVGELVAHGAGKYITEFAVESEDGSEIATYDTIDELQGYWETYKPAEPLIKDKDEKVREAVRAFSEAIQEKKHILVIKQHGRSMAEFSNGSLFWIRLPLSNETMNALEDRTYYTIDELCGEEKE